MDIGFIGSGEVADAIMDRLRGAGHRLRVRDHVRGHLGDHGRGRDSARALAEGCDVVMLMLPDAGAVDEALFADGGLAAALPPGGLLIDLSRLPPAVAALNAARVAERGGLLVDAPVAVSQAAVSQAAVSQAAASGAMDFTVDLGGADAACARAEPLLRLFAAAVERAGGPGEGQRARLGRMAMLEGAMPERAAPESGDPDGLHRLLHLMAFDEAARTRPSAG